MFITLFITKLNLIWLWIFDRFIIYPILTYIAPKLIRFMNLGYIPKIGEDLEIREFFNNIQSCEYYEGDKPHLFLYEKALSLHPNYPKFNDFDILEISCGQANSLDWIRCQHGPLNSLIGCDKVITRQRGDLVFGDATDLPFSDNSFDLVINIEASHLYLNGQKFFNECYRVLHEGGTLCWLDIRYPHEVEIVKKQAANSGLRLQTFEDITENILLGLEETSKKHDNLLANSPFFIKMFSNSLRSTYCAPGTSTHTRIANRERIYLAASWRK